MASYTISTKEKRDILTVEADSPEKAAQIAVKRLNRQPSGRAVLNISALRTTGTARLSGWFQGYVPVSGGGLTSYGTSFHVM